MFLPASLAPMILKLIMPKVNEHLIKVFKLEKVLQYVELPNEADIRLDKLEAQIEMLAKDSHPPKPFDERISALEKKSGK